MKRINPETGKPFKQGDTREDGYFFKGYKLSIGVKKNGFYGEYWYNPLSYKKRCEDNKKGKKRIYNFITKFLNKWKSLKGCHYCHNEFRPTSLQFHHIDRKTKSNNVSEMWRSSWKSIVKLKNEIRKCHVTCYNCHTLITMGENKNVS